jgi:nucleoside-triphosphatase THEP1
MPDLSLTVLTGPVHAGKTTFLKEFLERPRESRPRINGVLSLARFEGNRRIGYDAWNLLTSEFYPLFRKFPEPEWTRVGSYGVVPEGMRRARAAVSRFRGCDLTVIDEIGPLELRGGGFWPCVKILRDRRRRLLAVIREDLLASFRQILDTDFSAFHLQDPDLGEHLDRRLFGEASAVR